MKRCIIHVDMDAFFAAVEQRDNPILRGQPVIVGGLSGRGVVATASYEARKFGVRSAMPMAEARRRCPQGVFLTCDHAKYSEVSRRIMDILAEFSPVIEPLSLDEAFLDMTGTEWLYPDIAAAARQIKDRINIELSLVASVGVAPNKFLAKLASDLRKPDGLVIIKEGEAESLLSDLPVSRLWGVGATTAASLYRIGITTIGDVAKADCAVLERHCGSLAYEIQRLAHGHDERPVISGHHPKSIGKETTFEADLTGRQQIESELLLLAERVGWRLRRYGYSARTITLKIRFASFRTITRSKTLHEPTNFDEDIYKTVQQIWQNTPMTEGVRLVGISTANLQVGCSQISLFSNDENEKRRALYNTVDKLKERFGEAIVTKGRLIKN